MATKDVIIVGAGACGLSAARELSKLRKRVTILEARDRIGGRIWSLDKEEFGYKAEAGAEFVHGEAPLTHSLTKEAGLTYEPMDGETWSIHGRVVSKGGPTENQDFIAYRELIHEKLWKIEKDISISEFLDKYFGEDKYIGLRDAILGMVEEYDAADPKKISTFSLREEWLGDHKWLQGRIKEGYGGLINFLASGCGESGVEVVLSHPVKHIDYRGNTVVVTCNNGEKFEAQKVIVTVPLPVLAKIDFSPGIPDKLDAISKLDFSHVIKLLIKFREVWWIKALGKDLSRVTFLLSDEIVGCWWTQYPQKESMLTGWVATSKLDKFKNLSEEEILDMAVKSLGKTLDVSSDFIYGQIIKSRIFNWSEDEFAMCAYSYDSLGSEESYKELSIPIANKIFFAGEALPPGRRESATVEGALASGLYVAKKLVS